ncbi:MAG: hypothetical protein IKI66_08740 [Bacteroidales bacterium]|nr:hypothetical protein [Bacteroidales bacterium]
MKRILVLFCTALLLTACHNASQDPVIKGYWIQQVDGLGMSAGGVTADMVLNLDVENPSNATYTLETLHADVYRNGENGRFAEVTLPQSASIAPKSNQSVAIPLQVLLLRPLALIAGGEEMLDLSQYVADLDLTVRKGSLKKRIQRERVPLKDLQHLLSSPQTPEKE